MKRAVFPGSFDPITLGHVDVVTRALKLFDEIIIAIGTNTSKNYMFTQEQRESFARQSFPQNSRIQITPYEKLTVDFCKKMNADFIIRGLRNSGDFEYEASIAQMNHDLNNTVETVFIVCAPQYAAISSTIIREIIRNGGDISQFVGFEF